MIEGGANLGKTSNLNDGPSVKYINEVVLKGLGDSGITMTADCRITNYRCLSAADFVTLLERNGWSWPRQWYRRNRNYFQHRAGASHFEKEVETSRWIHIVVVPALKSKTDWGRSPLRRLIVRRPFKDWTVPPADIELHAESGWLRPSSFEHLWKFLKEKLWRLLKSH